MRVCLTPVPRLAAFLGKGTKALLQTCFTARSHPPGHLQLCLEEVEQKKEDNRGTFRSWLDFKPSSIVLSLVKGFTMTYCMLALQSHHSRNCNIIIDDIKGFRHLHCLFCWPAPLLSSTRCSYVIIIGKHFLLKSNPSACVAVFPDLDCVTGCLRCYDRH